MDNKKHLHIIACGVLARDIQRTLQRFDSNISTQFLPGGLHERPNELRSKLQEAIDRESALKRADRIAIGYGLCGLGTVGVTAREIPLLIPRVHDCVALFLGSDAAYKEQFAKYPGTYYISAGWVLEKVLPNSMDRDKRIGVGPDHLDYKTVVEKYGEEKE